jgi:VWFA-related protein
MARFRALAWAAFVVAVSVAPGDAQQPQDQPQQPPPPQQQQPPPDQAGQPVFRAGINFVRVDAIVTDRAGNPVKDLQIGDFEISEVNKPQKIETFKYIDLDGGLMSPERPREIRTDADEEAESARDDVRLFGIFLDDYHVREETSMAARQQIARFIDTQLGPTDMVAVMYPLEPIVSVRFTRNHAAVKRAIEQFTGRKFKYDPQNQIEQNYIYRLPTETVERIRNQVSMSAIESLASRMGGLKEGRKAIVLVSEGYSNMLPPQMRNPVAGYGGAGNPTRGDPTAGDTPLEERAQAFASFDLLEDLRHVYAAANRNNVAIYPVDPRGLATSEFGISENISGTTDRQYLTSTMDSLRIMAEQTDGRAIVNRNDLTVAMKQIVRDSSAYYLLGYNSTLAATDGKFHEIKVRVRRSGLQVRARRGYWALTPDEVARATAAPAPSAPKPVETALAAVNYPTRSRVIRTWIGTARGENGKTRVTFVWEPVPRAPGDAARNGEQPARVALTAVAKDGTPYFRGRVPETTATTSTTASTAAPPSGSAAPAASGARIVFDAPPGPIQLRLSVEGSRSEVLDSETREITVPDLTSAEVVLGTPAIFRARTVRDVQQAKTNPDVLPTAVREFPRTERIVVRIPAYGPAGSTAAVTARLLNRAGQPMSDVPVASGDSGSSGGVATIELSLAGLASGEYVLEIGAAGSDTKELVGFRVTG